MREQVAEVDKEISLAVKKQLEAMQEIDAQRAQIDLAKSRIMSDQQDELSAMERSDREMEWSKMYTQTLDEVGKYVATAVHGGGAPGGV